jgi:glycosyltransferase involved in cell wall biosynthesis
LKIAFINQPFDGVLPPQLNSIGLWTYEVARRLAGACEVHVFAGIPRLRKHQEVHGQVYYHFVPVAAGNAIRRRDKLFTLFERPGRPLFALSPYYLDYVARVARDLRNIRPDIIHVLNFSQFVPILRRKNPSSKIALHMQCEWLTQMDPSMIGRRLEQTDWIVGCSHYIAEAVGRAFPFLAPRCHGIYNAVDPDIFFPASSNALGTDKKDFEILYVGRGSPEKGIHDLLQAFEMVLKRHQNVRLRLIGGIASGLTDFIAKVCDDDPLTAKVAKRYRRNYREQLQRMITPEAASRISFEGEVPNHQLPECYRRADLFAFPSAWNEPFGIPIIEAMACEKPVVATRGGGIPEIIEHEKTGLLVERGNPDELSKAICRLIENESLRSEMGEAGRRRVLERFSWDRIASDLLEVYEGKGSARVCWDRKVGELAMR